VNDTELDEMLDQWKVPPVPASLRENVRAGFVAALEQKPLSGVRMRWIAAWVPGARKSLFAGAALGAGFLLLIVTQALPHTPPPVNIPYTVDSEFVRYADDGSPSVEMYLTSYAGQNGATCLATADSAPDCHIRGVGKDEEVQAAIYRFYHRLCGLDMPAVESLLLSKGRNRRRL
jgi:hypothetical protein